MMKQSRMEVFNEIENFAKQFGFEVEKNAYECKIIDPTHTVNFTIWMDSDFSKMDEGYITTTYTVRASIATMGGNPTGNDLQQMSAIIGSAGCLVNTLKLQQDYFNSLSFVQYIERPATEKEPEINGEVESYKITVNSNHCNPKRRETKAGALALAKRLQESGKHGTVEAVVYDASKPDSQVEFVVIKKF